MLSLKFAAMLLDPASQVISTKSVAQKMSLQSPISLLSLLRLIGVCGNKVDNVEQALNAVNKHGKFYYLEGKCVGVGLHLAPSEPVFEYSYVRGVASYNDYIIMTHSESINPKTGSLIILNQKSNKIVNIINTPVEYNHPGGIQQIGNFLAVSLEHHLDPPQKDASIRFYDLRNLSDTQPPILLEKPIIYRNNKKARAVGITTYKENGIDKFLVAVCDRCSVDFYKSNGKLLSDPQCIFEFINSCKLSPGADNLCLITDREEKVYMVCFRSDRSGDSCDDYVDLHLIDTSTMAIEVSKYNIHFISDHKMLLSFMGVHFMNGAGIRILSPQNIEVLATQRYFESAHFFLPNQKKIGINLFPSLG